MSLNIFENDSDENIDQLEEMRLINDDQIKDTFLIKLYFYYIHKGYFNIISTQIVNILITVFIFLFLLFMSLCINFSGLFNLEDKGEFSDYIKWNNIFNLNITGWLFTSIFLIFLFCRILSLIDDIKEYLPIRKFYNSRLFINDRQLTTTKWEAIVNKLSEITDCKYINVYNVSSKIMAKDNYLISLIDNKIINLNYMTKLMEWNIKFCIINTIFSNNKINLKLFKNTVNFNKIINIKLKVVSIVNFLFMPLIIMFIFFYNIFKYGEVFYNNPELISARNWTLMAKWHIREYNEMYHLFHERLVKSNILANEYINQFPSKLLETFSKLILFISSSILLLFIFLTIVNENLLINLNVTESRPILWYIGILGSIIAITKGIIKNKMIFYPKEKLIEIQKNINFIPDEWVNNAERIYVKTQFTKLFEYQIKSLLKELFFITNTPFQLWTISNNVDDIVDYFIENTVYEPHVGYKCADAIFKPYLEDNPNTKKKINNSIKNFKIIHPDFADNHFYNDNSVQFNIRNNF